MAPGDSFLREHGATLDFQGAGRWQLAISLRVSTNGERLPFSVGRRAFPIAAFAEPERDALGLTGLVPEAVDTEEV
jgi:hypothetical protein